MPFDNNLNNSQGDPRPSTHWNNVDVPLTRTGSPIHEHEFGQGYDIIYKDAQGTPQAKMDGLTPAEMAVLRPKLDC